MRHAHLVRDRAGEPDGVRRAAGRLGVVLLVAPELDRDRDGVAPRARDQQRGDRRVDAAAHRDERAPRIDATAAPPDARPSARCSASEARSAACSLPGESPPSSSAIARVPTRAASSSSSPADQRHGRAAPAAVRSAAARGVEAGLDDAIAVHAHGDADQVPADRAPGVAVEAPGKHDAAPHGRGEVFGEALAVHGPPSLGGVRSTPRSR